MRRADQRHLPRALVVLGLIVSSQGTATRLLAQPYAYVAKIGSESVAVIDTVTATVATTIQGGRDPDGVAVSPDGRWAYVANFLSDSVSVIDTGSNTVTTTVAVGSGPVGLAVTPDGASVYVTNRDSATVSVIRTADQSVVTAIG